MRILVQAIGASNQPSGVCRHAANLVRCLLSRPEISKVRMVIGPWAEHYFRRLLDTQEERLEIFSPQMQNTSLARNLWSYRTLPHVARRFEADIVHMSYPMPVHRKAFACPVVITLHDLYPYEVPHNFGYPQVFINRAILRQSCHSAHAIVCVSQSTLNSLTDHQPSSIGKALRIYNCVEQRSQVDRPPLPELDEYPFVLMVAQHRRNKNLPLALRAFSRLLQATSHPSLKLLIVGNDGPETKVIYTLIRAFKLDSRVLFINGVSDGELQWCYHNCELFLATSIAEGFGLPVAEAVLAGCRVVCSDLPVFREVSREVCRFVPLGSAAEDTFTAALTDALSARRMKPVALPQFSKAAIAEEYLGLYQGLICANRTLPASAASPALSSLAQTGRMQ